MSALKVLPSDVLERELSRKKQKTDVRALQEELTGRVEGEVRFDDGTRAMYAVDGSNYRQPPVGVVIPRSIDDVVQTVATCREFDVPILSRGGGTSLAGQCCNTAVVMDWSKYVNRIIDIDPDSKAARVQPGCICDNLRNAAGEYGLTFGPDPATHDHCTLGGMLGNNSCGVHAQMAGSVASNTEALEILTSDGTRMHVGWMTEGELEQRAQEGGRAGQIMADIKALRDRYADEIRARYPDIPRRISGYNLDQLLPDKDGRFNLARALVGSESTLITILEATLRLVHNPPYRSLLVLGYPDVYQAGDDVPNILEYKPMGFEGMDHFLIENMLKKHLHAEDVSHLPDGKGWLMVEMPGETRLEADDRAREVMARLRRRAKPPSMKLYDDPSQEKTVWKVRESGLGATAFVPGMPPTWEGWEDSAVPVDKVGDYLRDLCKLYEKYDYVGALYGHFGMGCIHTRITFDLMSKRGVKRWRSFIEEAAELVTSYGGSLSGEHGDGQSRAEFLPIMFGNKIVRAFDEYKAIWDPLGLMNPRKLVYPYRVDENLRLGADYDPWKPKTYFKFPDDNGSFAHAALRCVGIGKCRRERSDVAENQTMCPSYMVTREEKHSTRGRAHLLWEMLQGDVIKKGWRDENVKEALDLCLSCKGCKGDCPVNVDMATYKAEFLAHYWEGRIRPRAAYAFGFIDKWAKLAAIAPGLANLVTSTPGLRDLAKVAAGMPQQREIPQFAPETFVSWFRKREPQNRGAKKVLLFPDTFNNHFFPRTLRAAVEVLESAGYEVTIPRHPVCCGRPLYDYGFLKTARSYLKRVMKTLGPAAREGTPIIALEPSCWSVLRDELKQMFPEEKATKVITENTYLLGEFLEKKAEDFTPPTLRRKALMHAHCHHKAILQGAKSEESLLKKMQVDVEQLTDGCCGMAGSFGFEEDKYDVSVQVGEHMLLPAVRSAAPDTIIVADGFSCREQVSQLTERHALHPAEVIQMALHDGDAGSEMYPERPFVEEHERAITRSKQRTALTLAGITIGAAGLAWWLRGARRRGK